MKNNATEVLFPSNKFFTTAQLKVIDDIFHFYPEHSTTGEDDPCLRFKLRYETYGSSKSIEGVCGYLELLTPVKEAIELLAGELILSAPDPREDITKLFSFLGDNFKGHDLGMQIRNLVTHEYRGELKSIRSFKLYTIQGLHENILGCTVSVMEEQLGFSVQVNTDLLSISPKHSTYAFIDTIINN